MMLRMIALSCLFLAGVAPPAVVGQERGDLMQKEILPIRVPVTSPFAIELPVPGPNDIVYVPMELVVNEKQKQVVLKVDPSGSVKANFEIGNPSGFKHGEIGLVVTPGGELIGFSRWSAEGAVGPVIYLFDEQGSVKEAVKLSKRILPRQMVVTPEGSWIFAGYAEPTGADSESSRQGLFEFKRSGEFVREIAPRQMGEKSGSTISSRESQMVLDLSQLLMDATGTLYLIHPLDRPRVFKISTTGEILKEKQLSQAQGTRVLAAVFDDQGRLVLDRVTVARAGETLEKRIRILTVLETGTLDTVFEASCEQRGGVLFSAKNGEFSFMVRRDPTSIEIARWSVR